MKKPSYFSTSSTNSSSTTTASTDETLDTLINHSVSGCISTVLRTILRRKLLSTHLSHHEKYTGLCLSEKAKCSPDESIANEASGTPNLVAKLMGLDSIPVGSSQKDLSAVARSRSMNAAETWKGFEATETRPRRTKSFRDIPSFLELEDENFFILSFENKRKNRTSTSKGTKSEKGYTETGKLRDEGRNIFGESKKINENRGISKRSKRESVYENYKENMVVNLNCTQKNCIVLRDKRNGEDQKGTNDFEKKSVVKLREPLSKKKCFVEGRRIKKRKDDCLIVEGAETSINSQNSSPNSVLEDVELHVGGNANCLELSSGLTGSKPTTLWEELENYRKRYNPREFETSISNDREAKESKKKGDNSSKIIDIENKFHAKILKSNCKLAEEETLRSIWMLKDAWKLKDYVKVGENLEAGILDHMIDEVIDQLTDV